MSVELTVDEKISIIDQHIKQMQYSIYGSELDLIEANAIADVDETVITSITNRISTATAKKDALVLTRASLTN
jgi:hypothetical protein